MFQVRIKQRRKVPPPKQEEAEPKVEKQEVEPDKQDVGRATEVRRRSLRRHDDISTNKEETENIETIGQDVPKSKPPPKKMEKNQVQETDKNDTRLKENVQRTELRHLVRKLVSPYKTGDKTGGVRVKTKPINGLCANSNLIVSAAMKQKVTEKLRRSSRRHSLPNGVRENLNLLQRSWGGSGDNNLSSILMATPPERSAAKKAMQQMSPARSPRSTEKVSPTGTGNTLPSKDSKAVKALKFQSEPAPKTQAELSDGDKHDKNYHNVRNNKGQFASGDGSSQGSNNNTTSQQQSAANTNRTLRHDSLSMSALDSRESRLRRRRNDSDRSSTGGDRPHSGSSHRSSRDTSPESVRRSSRRSTNKYKKDLDEIVIVDSSDSEFVLSDCASEKSDSSTRVTRSRRSEAAITGSSVTHDALGHSIAGKMSTRSRLSEPTVASARSPRR